MGARGPRPGYKKTAQTAEKPESGIEPIMNEQNTNKLQSNPAPALTPEQQAIAARVAEQATDDDWLHIREDEMLDFSLSKNMFDLPPEAQKLQDEKKYAFKFCERTPSRVDQLTRGLQPPLRWGVVNAVQLPELAHLCDPMTGGVCVGGMILLFKPWRYHQMVKDAKRNLSDGRVRSGSLDGAALKLSSPDGKVQAATGEAHKIGNRDVVMTAEDPIDLKLPAEGVEDLVA